MSVCSNPSVAVACFPYPADSSQEVLICHVKGWWFGVHNNHRSVYVCSGLRAPQLRIRPRPCPISGVRAKIILYYKILPQNIRQNSQQADKRRKSHGECFFSSFSTLAPSIFACISKLHYWIQLF